MDVNYLTCKDICIPGNAHLELLIPSGIGQITEHSFIIEKSLSLIPIDNLEISGLKNVSTKATADSDNVSIIITASSLKAFIDPKFYLDTEFGLPVITPKINYSANYKSLKANFVIEKKLFTKKSFNLGVIIKNNNQAFKINNDLTIEEKQSKLIQNNSLIYFLLIAFVGGLILNVMPCVLPVLSIKLLSILKKPKERGLIRKSFDITSTGIVTSFMLLSLIFIILRLIGINIGWGMQFQQPLFLLIIALIFVMLRNNNRQQAPIPPWMMPPPPRRPRPRRKESKSEKTSKESAQEKIEEPASKADTQPEPVVAPATPQAEQPPSSEDELKKHDESSLPSSDDDPNVVRSEINDIRKSVVSMSVGQPDRTTTIVKEWLEQPEPAPPAEEESNDSNDSGDESKEADEKEK